MTRRVTANDVRRDLQGHRKFAHRKSAVFWNSRQAKSQRQHYFLSISISGLEYDVNAEQSCNRSCMLGVTLSACSNFTGFTEVVIQSRLWYLLLTPGDEDLRDSLPINLPDRYYELKCCTLLVVIQICIKLTLYAFKTSLSYVMVV